MLNNVRIEPMYSNHQPSAPPAPFQPVTPQLPQVPGMLSVPPPPTMYSMPPTLTQPQYSGPPTSLKPLPHPPPAPSLNEVYLTEERQRVRCPYCQASITTKVSFRTGMMTHIAGLAVLCVCCPLAWLPYVIDMCKDVDHSCPNCNRHVGRFKRFT